MNKEELLEEIKDEIPVNGGHMLLDFLDIRGPHDFIRVFSGGDLPYELPRMTNLHKGKWKIILLAIPMKER